MVCGEPGDEQPCHKDGETSHVLTDTKLPFQGQTAPTRCELAAWFISSWCWVPSQKFKLPIKNKKKKNRGLFIFKVQR